MAYEFVDFNDTSVPIGKRKQAYVRYVVSKGTDLDKARIQASRKFGGKSQSYFNKTVKCPICQKEYKVKGHRHKLVEWHCRPCRFADYV